MKRILVIPVFNEGKHIENVLGALENEIDIFIIVNDGSTDSSEKKIFKWGNNKKNFYYLASVSNEGMANAMRRGFLFIIKLLKENMINEEDVVVNMDADGQHNPKYVRGMINLLKESGLDIVLARRDFSNYPLYRRLGNRLLSIYNSFLCGYKYKDVECGFRVLKARIVPEIMKYYVGYRYTNAQEIAMITALLNYKINNVCTIEVPYYRSGDRSGGPNFLDCILNIALCTFVCLKVRFNKKH